MHYQNFMKNKYVSFISDKHFLGCIANLHKAYIKAKNNISKRDFYNNKIDTIKLTFDSKFNDIDEEGLIQTEISRLIDKSIITAIKIFHIQILGGMNEYEIGRLNEFDIKAKDNSLFAYIFPTEMQLIYEEYAFQKLANRANSYKKSKFYYVSLLSTENFNEKWVISDDESRMSHKRVFKISINKFYYLLTGQVDAFNKLKSALPLAMRNYLKSINSKLN